MTKFNLSGKRNTFFDDKKHIVYEEEDIKEFIKIYKFSLIKNASEKRKIIEVDKAIVILNELVGEELI